MVIDGDDTVSRYPKPVYFTTIALECISFARLYPNQPVLFLYHTIWRHCQAISFYTPGPCRDCNLQTRIPYYNIDTFHKGAFDYLHPMAGLRNITHKPCSDAQSY
jgi:hypothetical protein